MDEKQYKLCRQVLERLHNAGVLENVVVAGSWCMVFYQAYFDQQNFMPTIRTRDLDFAVPIPPAFTHTTDITKLLDELGFVLDFQGRQGYMRFLHPDLIVEFLVPERGRGADHAFDIPALGVNAQPLRYLDLSLTNTITVTFRGISIRLPHPARFALHKLIVAERRADADKAERDREQAILVLHAVMSSGDAETICRVYESLPAKWQKTIAASLLAAGQEDLMTKITSSLS